MSVKTKEGESSFRQGMSLDCNTDLIKPVNPKGTQSWIFIGRADAEAETPILGLPIVKNWLNGKTLMLGKTEGRRREWQRMRWLDSITDDGHEFKQALGIGDRQGILACCSPWGHKESDMTELNWGSSVYGILQARILSGLPFPSPEALSHLGIELTNSIKVWREWNPLQYSCLGNPMDRGAWIWYDW